MIVTFNSGKGGRAHVQYLEKGEVKTRLKENGQIWSREELDERITLGGNLAITGRLIEQVEKKNWSTSFDSLVYSFAEDDITAEKMQEIMEEHFAHLTEMFNEGEINYYAEAHIPKIKYMLNTEIDKFGKKTFVPLNEQEAQKYIDSQDERLVIRKPHIHVTIPKMNMVTQTQLKLWERHSKIRDRDGKTIGYEMHREDRQGVNAIQEVMNLKHGLSSPRDIQHRRDHGIDKHAMFKWSIPNLREAKPGEIKKSLYERIAQGAKAGEFKNLQTIAQWLETQEGVLSARHVKTRRNESIRLSLVGHQRDIILKDKDSAWLSSEHLSRYQTQENQTSRKIDGKTLVEYEKEMETWKVQRKKEVSKRYDFKRTKALKLELVEQALNQKYEHLENCKSPEIEDIIKKLESGQNLFLTGGAGVGKSYATRAVIEHYQNSGKTVAKLASAGLASTHINGQTLHSFFGIGIEKDLEKLKKYDALNPAKLEATLHKIAASDLIVMDEVSMVSARTMDLISYRLYQAGFTGRIMMIGDFCQLPPVEKEKKYQNYRYAFESSTWSELGMETLELTEIKRSDNEEFARILNDLRYGKVTTKAQALFSKMENNQIDEEVATYIFPTNKQANKRNSLKLAELDTPLEKYVTHAEVIGEKSKMTAAEMKQIFEEIPFEKELEIKMGATVLLTVNDRNKRFVNGDKGRYLGMKNGEMVVELERTGAQVEIPPITLEQEIGIEDRDGKNKDIEIEATGYPVRLGYGITIHKSQGMSIEHLHIDPARIFEFGQFYTAVSRARNPETVQIAKSTEKEKYEEISKTDAKVLSFYHPELAAKAAWLKESEQNVKTAQKEWAKKQKEISSERKEQIQRAAPVFESCIRSQSGGLHQDSMRHLPNRDVVHHPQQNFKGAPMLLHGGSIDRLGQLNGPHSGVRRAGIRTRKNGRAGLAAAHAGQASARSQASRLENRKSKFQEMKEKHMIESTRMREIKKETEKIIERIRIGSAGRLRTLMKQDSIIQKYSQMSQAKDANQYSIQDWKQLLSESKSCLTAEVEQKQHQTISDKEQEEEKEQESDFAKIKELTEKIDDILELADTMGIDTKNLEKWIEEAKETVMAREEGMER